MHEVQPEFRPRVAPEDKVLWQTKGGRQSVNMRLMALGEQAFAHRTGQVRQRHK